jgi:hypothetical protein
LTLLCSEDCLVIPSSKTEKHFSDTFALNFLVSHLFLYIAVFVNKHYNLKKTEVL